MAGVPVRIAGEHGTARYPLSWKWWYEPWIDRTSDLVIAISHSSRQLLEYKYRVPANRIQVIHDAIRAPSPEQTAQDVRAELAIPEGVKIVGNVARLNTVKDHFTLIEAARIVLRQRDDVRFLIVGGGPLEDELRSLIHQYGLDDRFLLTGWRRDIVDLLQMFDMFVSTSMSEPLGSSIIEAMWSGVPVIAPAVDGIPEFVQSGETGILLQPTEPVRQPRSPGAEPIAALVLRNGTFGEPRSLNPQVLADTICNLLNQPSECIAMADRAKQAVQSYFHIHRYVTELENAYLRLAQAKGIIEPVSAANQ
jgi:glycosyltransferase involved in cell wall biosynthesis